MTTCSFLLLVFNHGKGSSNKILRKIKGVICNYLWWGGGGGEQMTHIGVGWKECHMQNKCKVETPIHDNDLILTPIIAPQSG